MSGETEKNSYTKAILRKSEWWGDAILPGCRCGCGEMVTMGERGPKLYVNREHGLGDKIEAMRVAVVARWVREREAAGNIEIEKFRSAVKKIKKQKGWTWQETADRGGWSLGMLRCYMYDRGHKSVGLDIGVDFLRRLGGMSAPPSTYQKRLVRQATARQVKVDKDMEME